MIVLMEKHCLKAKKEKKTGKKWVSEYIFNCWKYIWFKASKISLNNKVIFVASMIYLFYKVIIVQGVKMFGKRSLRKTFYCLGVGQVTWIGCGEFQCCRTNQEAHWELSWAVTDKRKHRIFIQNGLVKRL